MPELPEVETTIRGLKPIINCTIINIKIHTPKLRFYIPKSLSKIPKEKKIKAIKRRGKYILLNLEDNYTIVIHLGMSGRLRLLNCKKFHKQKHDHFILRTNQDHCLVFNDARKFGLIDYGKKETIYQKRYLSNLGKDALSSSLTYEYLALKISKKIVPIKQLLLDQKIIAGIGNIYASEILFDAKISPICKGKDLSMDNCRYIVNSIRKILKRAIFARGSTLKDYVATDGKIGDFQNNFKVYGKSGQKILGKPIIKIIQYGRSTFYCPDFQIKK